MPGKRRFSKQTRFNLNFDEYVYKEAEICL